MSVSDKVKKNLQDPSYVSTLIYPAQELPSKLDDETKLALVEAAKLGAAASKKRLGIKTRHYETDNLPSAVEADAMMSPLERAYMMVWGYSVGRQFDKELRDNGYYAISRIDDYTNKWAKQYESKPKKEPEMTATSTKITNPTPPNFDSLGAQELIDVIDEVAGTKTVTVTDASGKKKRVVSRLPRTEKEEQYYQQAQGLIGNALKNLSELFKNKPETVVEFKPVIDTFARLNEERVNDLAKRPGLEGINQYVNEFRDYQRNILNDVFSQHRMQQESQLAQSGHYNSTAGQAHRAYMAKQEALARQQADINARTYGEDIMAKRQQNFDTDYAARERARNSQLEQSLQQYTLAQQQKLDLERNKEQQIKAQLNQLQTGYALTGQDLQNAMNSKSAELGLGHSQGMANSAFQQATLNNQLKQNQFQNELSLQNRMNDIFSLLVNQNQARNAAEQTRVTSSANAQAGQNTGTTFGYEKPFSK